MNSKCYFRILIIGFIPLLYQCTQVPPSYPISDRVLTTEDSVITPLLPNDTTTIFSPEDVQGLEKAGYGRWQYEKGMPCALRSDLMPIGYTNVKDSSRKQMLRFFSITDIHLTDKESPAQVPVFGLKSSGIISAYSPAMIFSTQVLDAVVQTANKLHVKKPFDFAISLGDNCNSGQQNELRWFIDVMDGKVIKPYSGGVKDPVVGPLNDYQDEYQAAGLNKEIPWYQAIGNHDHFWMGIAPATKEIAQTFVGSDIIVLKNPIQPADTAHYRGGVVDGKSLYGSVIGAGPISIVKPLKVTADSSRRFLSKGDWISQFFNTSSTPIGHGFSSKSKDFACYSFEPKSKYPFKVIVLDDTQLNSDLSPDIHGHPSIDIPRYSWLVNELKQGQEQGKLMILAVHCPINIQDSNPELNWDVNAQISLDTMMATLHRYPNLVLMIAGHRHLNTITPQFAGNKQNNGGFWEVETSSLREFPQMFRTFDFKLNSNGTLSIFVVNVDPAVKKGSLADLSRSRAIMAYQVFKMPKMGPNNAELVVPLSEEMKAKLGSIKP